MTNKTKKKSIVNKLLLIIYLLILSIGVTIAFYPGNSPNYGLTKTATTPHFNIYSDNRSKGDYYALSLECIYNEINTSYIPINQTNPLNVYLVFDDAKFSGIARSHLIFSPVYGFTTNDGEAVINMNLGFGTVPHEMMHYYMGGYKKNYSMFASEGIATNFEKFKGHIGDNNPMVSFGYYHPRRIREAKAHVNKYTLVELINSPKHSNNDLSWSFMYYMKVAGVFNRFLDERISTDKTDQAIIEEIFQSDIASVDTHWKDWLNGVTINEQTDEVMSSTIDDLRDK